MKKKLFTIAILICAILYPTQSYARRVYVKLADDAVAWTSVTEDAENVVITLPSGSTDFVVNVLNTLQKGDEVWVAKGVYKNTGKLAIENITLCGGFEGTETSLTERAIADNDGNGLTEAWEFVNETNFCGAGNDSSEPSSFQMIHLTGTSVLDGITISDNYYKGNQASGGIVATGTTIRNCIIRDLTAEGSGTVNGGGLYVTGGHVESCLFENCTSIASNTIACYGGALHIYGFIDSTPGTPTGYIKNSMIRNCRAGQGSNNGRGAGIFGKGGVIIENCIIYNNTSTTSGAAFYFNGNGDGNTHVNRIIGSTLVNNHSQYSSFPECEYFEIYNTVIWGNASANPPVSSSYNSNIRLKAKNTAITAYPYIDGFAHNGKIQNDAAIMNTFSPIKLAGALNDSPPVEAVNPEFKSPTGFIGIASSAAELESIRKANWTLLETSPLVDAGVSSPTNTMTGVGVASLAASFSGVDIMGNIRNSGGFDIGAYEYTKVSTGIEKETALSYTIFVNNGTLNIQGLQEATKVDIYTINGALVSSANVSESTVSFPLAAKGVYVVTLKNNNKAHSQKVVF
ncbi:T9SS type A sorting domain-containing protein [Dysgonomonas sp. 520]|uniref:T9SS type A sorting domain-containing protein n=1 Tax=Dysgonomonas sp. 520 TaxID=2302931 RepID=UPI0013D2C8B5|nr:T9SS type A sorting domain-containing protein [Dysgonomonas sp. 520]